MKKAFICLLLSAILLSPTACAEQKSIEKTISSDSISFDQSQGQNNDTDKLTSSSETSEDSKISAETSANSENSISVDNSSVSTDSSEGEGTSSAPENDSPNKQTTALIEIDTEGITTLTELDERIDEYATETIDSLKTRWKALSEEVDTYQKYCDNSQKVSDFYKALLSDTEQMCITLMEYSAVYTRMILDSDLPAEKKYKAAEGICDNLYNDACDKIVKKVYNGILDDMLDYYYNGIIDDEIKKSYTSELSEISSKEYSQWSDTSSEVYSLYSDTSSDVYSLYSDLSAKLYNDDFTGAEKVYNRFLKKLAKEKGINTEDSIKDPKFDTTLREVKNADEFEDVVYDHVSECVLSLEKEWETLSEENNTIEKYLSNDKAIKNFHKHIEESVHQLFVMICEYGVTYAEFIMNSDSTVSEKRDAFENFKDCIYDDACSIIKDDVYDGLLKTIKKYYYDGIIKEAKDSLQYSEWIDAHSDTYKWWLDARSSVYSDWLDTRGDIYNFYLAIRGDLFSKDIDEAKDELDSFKKKVERMK